MNKQAFFADGERLTSIINEAIETGHTEGLNHSLVVNAFQRLRLEVLEQAQDIVALKMRSNALFSLLLRADNQCDKLLIALETIISRLGEARQYTQPNFEIAEIIAVLDVAEAAVLETKGD